MVKIHRGKAYGKTIELFDDAGFGQGETVEITIRTLVVRQERPAGNGVVRTQSVLTDDHYWDAIMEEIYHSRKRERRPPIEAL